MSDFNDGIEKAINEAINCISDLGAGKGGWAWEEVNDNLRTLLESLTRTTPDRSEARERIARLIWEKVYVSMNTGEVTFLDDEGPGTLADAILATGLVQDEASIRADERDKCAAVADDAELVSHDPSECRSYIAAAIRKGGSK